MLYKWKQNCHVVIADKSHAFGSKINQLNLPHRWRYLTGGPSNYYCAGCHNWILNSNSVRTFENWVGTEWSFLMTHYLIKNKK